MGVRWNSAAAAGLLIVILLLGVPVLAAEHVHPAPPAVTADLAALRTVSLDGSSMPIVDAVTAGDLHIAIPASAVIEGIGPGQSLQDAIDAASPGDTLTLDPGIYYAHNLTITKDIYLRANDSIGGNRENTIIDARGLDRIFNVSGSASLVIENLSLRNGNGTGDGGAVNSGGGSTIYIVSSAITNCSATGNGGAVSSVSGTVFVLGSVIEQCSADGGGAIYVENGIAILQASSVSRCSATAGGAILSAGSIIIVVSSTITSCSAVGGGALASLAGLTLVGNTGFSRCSATPGPGGAIFSVAGQVQVISSSFTDCSADQWGGAIESDSLLLIQSSTFTRCTALVDGGALDFYDQGAIVVSSVFTDCSVPGDGGAIWYSSGGDLRLDGSSFSNCRAGHYGGAVCALDGPSTAAIISSTFTGCSAGSGGAIFTEGPVNLHFSRVFGCDRGTAFWSNSSASNAENTWWGSNAAPAGSVHGAVDYDPWLILGITTSRPYLPVGQTSFIQTNMLWNSGGTNTSTGGLFVPDNITNTFTVDGSGTVQPSSTGTAEGRAGTYFTAGGRGLASVCGLVDAQRVCVSEHAEFPPATMGPDTDDDSLPGGPGGSPRAAESPSSVLPVTVTVNIGGNSAAMRTTVTGVKLSGLVVTGTAQPAPDTNQTAPPGIVYQVFSLDPAGYTSISSAVINFTVPQSWLDGNRIDPGSIVLYHRGTNGWEALPTTALYMKDGWRYYSTRTSGFSLFAIAGTHAVALPTVIVPTAEAEGNPGAGQTPDPAVAVWKPVAAETTAVPSTVEPPAGSTGIPFLPALAGVLCVGLIGGGFLARRWWVRRQNPSLFREYD